MSKASKQRQRERVAAIGVAVAAKLAQQRAALEAAEREAFLKMVIHRNQTRKAIKQMQRDRAERIARRDRILDLIRLVEAQREQAGLPIAAVPVPAPEQHEQAAT